MHGKCSSLLDLKEHNHETRRSPSRITAKRCEFKGKIDVEQITPKQHNEYFATVPYNSSMSACMSTVTRPFEIKHSLIQMVLSFNR